VKPARLAALVVALALSGCAGLQVGREFPSPEAAQIKPDVTDKARLLTLFGSPSSPRTSAVCSPRPGAGRRIVPGVAEAPTGKSSMRAVP